MRSPLAVQKPGGGRGEEAGWRETRRGEQADPAGDPQGQAKEGGTHLWCVHLAHKQLGEKVPRDARMEPSSRDVLMQGVGRKKYPRCS